MFGLADNPVIATVDPTFATGPSFPIPASAGPTVPQYMAPAFSGSNPDCPWYCIGALLGGPTDMMGNCAACFCQGPNYVYDEDLNSCLLASVEASANAAGAVAATQTPPPGTPTPTDCTVWYNQLFSSSCPSLASFNFTPWLIGAGVLVAALVILPMLSSGRRR